MAPENPILVLPPRYSEDTIALGRAAARLGWGIERLPGWHAPDWLREREVVLYGEPLFAAAVADVLNVFMLEPHAQWLPALPEEYRRRGISLTTLGEVRNIAMPAFIKPALDKCFRAGVYDSAAQLPPVGLLPEHTPVLVSEIVQWVTEYRCFVLDRQIVAASPYWRDGKPTKDAEDDWIIEDAELPQALELAHRVVADSRVALPPGVVVDVGCLHDGTWAVLEANSAWGAGLYGCDPGSVLPAVRRACVRKDRVSAEDRPWIVERV